ncbi:MAG: gas vesicle protein GvpN [Chloroflexi bacterium]|nr:gas vesicle protein GvpN [Chloroflexota bacterium]
MARLKEAGVLLPREGETFVETDYVRFLTGRALGYLRAGFPLHLSGPTGVGKTTLAFHIASRLDRPAVLLCGDFEFGTSDLVGGVCGYRKQHIADNFIRSVVKTDESMTERWIDNRLTTACEHGLTLIYDEFTRSRAEANNILLSVLEERILPLPAARGGRDYLRVHPDFSIIFTSNPEEYAGVQKSQDALRDRMITMELGNFDEATETAIVRRKCRLGPGDAERITGLVRKVRAVKANKLVPTVRACIMIGKLLRLAREAGDGLTGSYREICLDILMPEIPPREKKRALRVIQEMTEEVAL